MIKSHQQSPPPHSDPHPGTPGTVLALSAQALTLLFSFQIPGMTLSAPLIPLHSSQTVCLFGSTFPFWLDMLPPAPSSWPEPGPGSFSAQFWFGLICLLGNCTSPLLLTHVPSANLSHRLSPLGTR